MQTEMRLNTIDDAVTEILLSIPSAKALQISEIIKNILIFSGHKVSMLNAHGEEFIPISDVFDDRSPALALRDLRVKKNITQAELAERLAISQNMVSEMESGKRNISVNMAKRLGVEFQVSYKNFI